MNRRKFLSKTATGVLATTVPSRSLHAVWGAAGNSHPVTFSPKRDDIIRFIYPQRPLGISWQLNTNDVTALYGSYVGGVQGAVQYQDPDAKPPGAYWLAWTGGGAVSWNVNSSLAADYEVNLCYASCIADISFSVSTGVQTLRRKTVSTQGYFPNDRNAPMNFERIPLAGRVRLAKGENIIRLQFSDFEGAIRVRSLELIPIAAKATLRRDSERARANRANTDWFVQAGYGLFIHWTSQVPPLKGKVQPYAKAVAEFDVPKFVNTVVESGAGYLIFTANHAEPTFPAPLKEWEHYHPGWTTKRDLINELANELEKHNIRLVVYLASEILGGVRASNGVSRLVSTPEYQDAFERILVAIGNRYGEKIAGYWFDHLSWSKENYPNLSFRRLWHALKAGNPKRLIAYNFWQFPVMTEWQDYWANEGAITIPPTDRYANIGPAKGLQYHVSVPIDGAYMHLRPDTDMEGPIYKNEQLIEFVKACIAKKGVVSLGTGISQDLQMSGAIVRQLGEVRKAVRGY